MILDTRQVGKTTLVEHILAGRGAVFLNFDVEVDKARFRAAATLAPGEALRSLGDPAVLVIDEAQRLPEASRIIKGWHDARLPAKFLLLGSSSLDLLDQAAESLTGRNRKPVLPPLLFAEALGSRHELELRGRPPAGLPLRLEKYPHQQQPSHFHAFPQASPLQMAWRMQTAATNEKAGGVSPPAFRC